MEVLRRTSLVKDLKTVGGAPQTARRHEVKIESILGNGSRKGKLSRNRDLVIEALTDLVNPEGEEGTVADKSTAPTEE